jgi:hypothetical protein
MRPSCARTFALAKTREGAGNAGCAVHPQSVCKGSVHTVVTTGHRNTRHFLRNGFTAYFALSLVTGLCCHHRRADTSARLERQRRGVRTTRLRRPQPRRSSTRHKRATTTPRPPHPIPTFVTMANAPLPGQDGANKHLIWVKREAGNFSEQGWTGKSPMRQCEALACRAVKIAAPR